MPNVQQNVDAPKRLRDRASRIERSTMYGQVVTTEFTDYVGDLLYSTAPYLKEQLKTSTTPDSLGQFSMNSGIRRTFIKDGRSSRGRFKLVADVRVGGSVGRLRQAGMVLIFGVEIINPKIITPGSTAAEYGFILIPKQGTHQSGDLHREKFLAIAFREEIKTQEVVANNIPVVLSDDRLSDDSKSSDLEDPRTDTVRDNINVFRGNWSEDDALLITDSNGGIAMIDGQGHNTRIHEGSLQNNVKKNIDKAKKTQKKGMAGVENENPLKRYLPQGNVFTPHTETLPQVEQVPKLIAGGGLMTAAGLLLRR